MNGIFSKSAKSARMAGARKTNQHKNNSVETAGSLAMLNYNPFAGMMKTQLGDIFSPTNPVAINYEKFADCNYVPSDCIAFSGGFDSAMSAFVSSEGYSGGDFGGSFSDSGFSGGMSFSGGGDCSCGASSGGSFSSVC